jgi:hypothetical protein
MGSTERAEILDAIRLATSWTIKFKVSHLLIARQGDRAIAVSEVSDASQRTEAGGVFLLENGNSKWSALYSVGEGGGSRDCNELGEVLKNMVVKAQEYSTPREYSPGFLPGGIFSPARVWTLFVLWDPAKKETIRQENLHHGADYTPYEGQVVTGWPVLTVLRGKIVAENGRITGSPEDGQFLKRGISPFATPSRIAKELPALL